MRNFYSPLDCVIVLKGVYPVAELQQSVVGHSDDFISVRKGFYLHAAWMGSVTAWYVWAACPPNTFLFLEVNPAAIFLLDYEELLRHAGF